MGRWQAVLLRAWGRLPAAASKSRRLRSTHYHPPKSSQTVARAVARAAADACDVDVTARYCGLTPLELEAVRAAAAGGGSW